jgi:hypothetical protein
MVLFGRILAMLTKFLWRVDLARIKRASCGSVVIGLRMRLLRLRGMLLILIVLGSLHDRNATHGSFVFGRGVAASSVLASSRAKERCRPWCGGRVTSEEG